MPVIYVATIPIRINEDRTIDILEKVREEVKKCGCVDVAAAATKLNTSVDDAKNAAKQLAGDGVIACDVEGKYCCTDIGRLNSFMAALKSLRSG